MFQIGFWELVVVFIVALTVLGPERLPAVARVLGRWILRAKQTYLSLKNEIDAEILHSGAPPQKPEKSDS